MSFQSRPPFLILPPFVSRLSLIATINPTLVLHSVGLIVRATCPEVCVCVREGGAVTIDLLLLLFAGCSFPSEVIYLLQRFHGARRDHVRPLTPKTRDLGTVDRDGVSVVPSGAS